ncbi:MAG: hypothetical protein HRT71_21455 [Flavobacteriales bacterium]|nr:hypothetical protein [Flavobacteriales bacterium]
MGKINKILNKAISSAPGNKSLVVKDENYLNIFIEKRTKEEPNKSKRIDSFKKIHINKNRKTNFTVTKIKTISMVHENFQTRVHLKDLTIERINDQRDVDMEQSHFTIINN